MEISPQLEDDADEMVKLTIVDDKVQGRRKPNMTDRERLLMANYLLKQSQGEARLPRAIIAAAADKFQVHRNTVSRIWNLMKVSLDLGASTDVVLKQVLSKKRGNCGRKKKDYSAALERVKQLPLNQRGSLRALSSAVGVPRTTLFRLLRHEGTTKSTSTTIEQDTSYELKPTIANSIKAVLSDKNKKERVRFCCSKLQSNGVFDNMFNMVHINTKWCSIPGKRDTKRKKVMFLIAVARPQWDTERKKQFDGKLGVWPFVMTTTPLSNSVDVSQTSHVFHVLETITKREIQEMIINNVIPAIKQNLPRPLHNGPVFIQMDNQQVRLTADDPVVAQHGNTDGWNIRVQYQPAYSPELVVLNHGLLKRMFPERFPPQLSGSHLSLIEELITGVEQTFAALPRQQINDAFLVLQKTMECILLAGGSNDFESQKDATKKSLQKDGSLPVSILCKREAFVSICPY
ncbi:unnamed protein product [Peronospora belbahrii]|uniref:Tc1-like transposase DDE domain-containing protein n=1 Tax=Peronospora belbahrii TaxID=622444 RepID=A0AAU9KQC5_9STRA|nr:unnamed protein product [Peronospora belbahrii]CAH0520728.1 unnamed protein product [Peronospora belbahrii]